MTDDDSHDPCDVAFAAWLKGTYGDLNDARLVFRAGWEAYQQRLVRESRDAMQRWRERR